MSERRPHPIQHKSEFFQYFFFYLEEKEMQDLCHQHRFFRNKDQIIGSGAQETVYSACSSQQIKKKEPQCRFVVKEIPLDQSTVFEQRAAEYRMGPQVFVLPCPSKQKTYLVQERMEGTLANYLQDKKTLTGNEKKQLSKLIYDSIQKMRIFHNDVHAENILYKKNGGVKFYLIDFSTAIPIDEIGYKKFDVLLPRHAFVRYRDGEIPILDQDQVKELRKQLRPTVDFTTIEKQKEKQRQEKIRAARQQASRMLQQRIRRLSSSSKNK